MYCPNCGAKNDDVGRFCEHCGAPLERPELASSAVQVQPVDSLAPMQSAASLVPAPKKRVSRGSKIAAVEIILLAAVGFLCYRQVQALNNPKQVVTRYMNAVLEEDWDEAYSYLDLPDSPYLTVEGFESMMKYRVPKGITSYRVQSQNPKKEMESDEYFNDYEVEMLVKGSSKTIRENVTVAKEYKKKWLILDDWKITLPDGIVSDTYISAPRSMTVKLDGILLDETFTEPGDETVYQIPYLFSGNNLMEVSMDGFLPYSEQVEINHNGNSFSPELPYMGEKTLENLADRSTDYWKQFMNDVINHTVPDFVTAEIQNNYDRSKDRFAMGGTDSYLEDIALSEISATLEDYGEKDGAIYAVVRLEGIAELTGQYGRYGGYRRPAVYERRSERGTAVLKAEYKQNGSEWELRGFTSNYRN